MAEVSLASVQVEWLPGSSVWQHPFSNATWLASKLHFVMAGKLPLSLQMHCCMFSGGLSFYICSGGHLQKYLGHWLMVGTVLLSGQIRLSTKSFDAECAEVAARGFANVAASLTDVDMSDVIAGRTEAQALEALRIMTCSLQVRAPCAVSCML